MALHLGPLGRLVTLRAPRPEIEIEQPRQGGTHVALSGARTVDYLGSRGKYAFAWRWISDGERDYLEALRDRHIAGPLRFVLDGWRRNRLSRSAASTGYGGRDLSGVTVTAGTIAPSRSWPDGVGLPGLSLSWSGWGAGAAVRLDRAHPVPVLPGESLACSVWVRSPQPVTLRLVADHYTAEGYTDATTTPDVTLTADTWQQLTATVAPDPGVWGVSLAIVPGATPKPAPLLIAAAQVEAAMFPTSWSPGGGAPVVMVDDLPVTAARAGYTHTTLTLLEA